MKTLLTLLLCIPLILNGQNLISKDWKFSTGDDPDWSAASYDDTDWKTLDVAMFWEKQGYEAYDGFGWYRKAVYIPDEFKNDAEKNGGLVLNLGTIDDADEIYWNGELFASHGSMPPHYKTAYFEERRLTLPAEKVNWSADNFIAVRVYDDAGNGGIRAPQLSLRIRGMEELLNIDVKPEFPDHIYRNVKSVVIPYELINNYNRNIEGTLEIKVISDFGEEILRSEMPVKIRKKRSLSEQVILEDLDPGFYNLMLNFSGQTDNKTFRLAFGKDPLSIESPVDPPADFSEYWSRAKRELAAIEPRYNLIFQDSLSTSNREVYLVEMRSLGNILIRGWLAKPSKPGTYPAILHVQGYSSNQKLDWAYPGDDMVVFALNIRGHGNSQDHINPGFPGYLQYFLWDPEMYIYRGAYMDCIRAVDFLYSLDMVDTSRVVVEGGSQGGALSFATAALDNERIDLCVPHVPFLSDFRDYFRLASWPTNEFINYEKENPEVSWDEIYQTLSYIDIKNLAPMVKAPVLMGVGLLDDVCPPHINFAAFNQLTVEKEFVVYPWSGHGINPEYHNYKYEWIKKKLGMNP